MLAKTLSSFQPFLLAPKFLLVVVLLFRHGAEPIAALLSSFFFFSLILGKFRVLFPRILGLAIALHDFL